VQNVNARNYVMADLHLRCGKLAIVKYRLVSIRL